jgi:hypothetical protein
MKKEPLPMQPEDTRALLELRSVLTQVSDLPPLAQWDTALQLLSDDFLRDFLEARKRKKEDERMTMYGPLAMTLVQYFNSQGGRDAQTLMSALIGLTYSVYGELERRHQQFCTDVVFMENPVFYDPEDPVTFVPKEPDTFSAEELFASYNAKMEEGGEE